MKLYGDYHTHTLYSHGKGMIVDNIASAQKLGLCDIAITDHGFRHSIFGVRRYSIPRMRKEIEEVRHAYPDVNVLLGVEANILGLDGEIDVKEEDLSNLDIIVAGYHKAALPKKLRDYFKYHYNSLYEKLTGAPTEKMRARSTEAFIKAIEKNPIDILSHVNYGLGVEVRAVAEACASYGTYLELNGKRINLTPNEFDDILKTEVKFVVDSDAHHPDRVGDTSIVDVFLDNYGRDVTNRIVNIDQRPSFRSRSVK